MKSPLWTTVHRGIQSAGRTSAWAVVYSAGAEPSSQEEERRRAAIGRDRPSWGWRMREGFSGGAGPGWAGCFQRRILGPWFFNRPGRRGIRLRFPQVGAGSGVMRRRRVIRPGLPWVGAGFRASGQVFGASGLVFHRLGLVVRPIRWIPGAGGFRRGSRRIRREGSIIMQKKFFLLYIWETKCMYSPQLEMHCVLGMIDHDL